MPVIRLLIVDDHLLVREGLRTILSGVEDIALIGEARTGDEAVLQARRLAPDVILMDLNMPGTNGIRATREILRRQPSIKIVALTAYLEEDRLAGAMQAGAVGIWTKDVEVEQLLRVIRGAQAGERLIHPDAVDLLLRAQRAASIDRLSEREHDVLELVGQGLGNRDIAARLSLSETTVKGHVSHILAKLGLKNRAQLALAAARRKSAW
ncbi:MAG TPA: response regulator transcription factor [Anaerolineae bacterium]|nr:response regulator transcription factor [Anaerolineae bacterium]